MPSSDLPRWDELLAAAYAWYLPTDCRAAESLSRRSLDWLAAAEIAEVDRLGSRPGDRTLRNARLVGRGLARVVLSHYTGVEPGEWKFVAGPCGKPAITGPAGFESLHFNLSRTAGLALCAVSRAGEVGVDVEETLRAVDIDQVARHFFSPSEQQRLAELPAERRTDSFFEQWVLKEAYLKGRGTGLARSPESFSIVRDDDGRPLDYGGLQFTVARPTPRHVAAVAVHPRNGAAIRVEWRDAQLLIDRSI